MDGIGLRGWGKVPGSGAAQIAQRAFGLMRLHALAFSNFDGGDGFLLLEVQGLKNCRKLSRC